MKSRSLSRFEEVLYTFKEDIMDRFTHAQRTGGSGRGRWRRRLALILTMVLMVNVGIVAPAAETVEDTGWVITGFEELPGDIRYQKVKPGTKEEELNLPKTLNAWTEAGGEEEDGSLPLATESGADRATDSDGQRDGLRPVPVIWTCTGGDNGLDHYDSSRSGVYTFRAEATGRWDMAQSAIFPSVSVEVLRLPDGEVIDTWWDWVELDPVETSAEFPRSARSIQDGAVDLRSGSYERWIDRAVLPEYALSFYSLLEEAADNDGVADLFIDDVYFSRASAQTVTDGEGRTSIFNGIAACEFKSLSPMTGTEWLYIQKSIRAAFDAFDRDHPEVFWLSGVSTLFRVGKLVSAGSGARYEYTIYFMTKTHSGLDSFDVREANYRRGSLIKEDIRKRDRDVQAILSTVSGRDAKEQIAGLNNWLTTHNEYNTRTDLGNAPKDAWECISALSGRSGGSGPVCEAYARALKVLCDRLGISCVLVDGMASATSGGTPGPHMWNYVEVDGVWYAVDVTWNDPAGGRGGALSGQESEDWLLLGADSVIKSGWTFMDSHPVSNQASAGGPRFVNGPQLSRTACQRKPTPRITFPSSSYKVGYTGRPVSVPSPVITIAGSSAGISGVSPSYSYRSSGASSYTAGFPKDAGTYEIRAHIPATDAYGEGNGYTTLTIEKSKAALAIRDSYAPSKTYDGSPVPVPGREHLTITGADYQDVTFQWYRDGVAAANRLSSAPAGAGRYVLEALVPETKNTQAASAVREVIIERRSVTVKADDLDKYFGSPDPVLTYTVDSSTPLAAGDRLKGSPAREEGEEITASGYVIGQGTLTDASNPDYRITFRPGVLTVSVSPYVPAPAAERVSEHEVVLQPLFTSSVTSSGTIRYGYSSSDDSGKVAYWQEGTTFSGLERGTTYYFFVKVTGSANYRDNVSSGSPITTRKAQLARPSLAQGRRYVYNGREQEVVLTGFDPERMVIISGGRATEAGEYTVVIGLKDPARDAWAGESGETVSLTWRIEERSSSGSGGSSGGGGGGSSGGGGGSGGGSSSGGGGASSGGSGSGMGSGPGGSTGAQNGALPSPGAAAAGTWILDGSRWRYQNQDGTYAAGTSGRDSQGNTREFIAWCQVRGVWWAFGADQFAKEGWILDAASDLWYSIDINSGMRTGWYLDGFWYYLDPVSGHMRTGWQQVGGVWYYLNPVSGNGRPLGAMYHNERTPDGYYVREDGSWDGRQP